jgi:hypothetical protein
MNNKLLLGLSIASGCILLVLIGFLGAILWNPGTKSGDPAKDKPADPDDSRKKIVASPGKVVERKETTNPPPPPKPVANPDRVRQNLQPGKTYVTHTKGALNVRATDKDWGVEEVVTINYAFEAQIDREIESNDGETIVELRHFRHLQSLKFECKLEDVRISLGPVGDLLLPQAQGLSLKAVITSLRWAGVSPEELIGLGDKAKHFRSVDRLSGKKVRLTYVDGKGVMKVEPVKGEMTAAERDFHLASVLVSDSLILSDVDVKIGNRWSVDGSNFANLVDPSLLARTAGEIVLERAPDHIVEKKTCRHLTVASGRILFDDSDPKVGRIGYFEPHGSVYFSPDDQVVIRARLNGKAKLEKFSKDHLLFEARMRLLPELDVEYTCRVVETLKAR